MPNQFNHEHINYFSIQSLDNLAGAQKLVRINEDCLGVFKHAFTEQAIIAMYKKDALESDFCIQKDENTKFSIKDYYNKNYNRLLETTELVKKLICDYSKIDLWGTGSYTMYLLANIPELEEHINVFIDNNKSKWGMNICGKKVCGPDQLIGNGQDVILICSMQNGQEIKNQIKEMGLNNKTYII